MAFLVGAGAGAGCLFDGSRLRCFCTGGGGCAAGGASLRLRRLS